MSEGREIIVQAIAEAGSRHGFKGVRGTSYYRDGTETICLLNLQRSSWGPQFYLNAAVWFTRFGPERRPKEYKCHIRWRVSSLMGENQATALTQALDLEYQMPFDSRHSLIKEGVDAYGFALLSRCETEQEALRLADEAWPFAMVAVKARRQEKVNDNG